jgi:hypothetical protein
MSTALARGSIHARITDADRAVYRVGPLFSINMIQAQAGQKILLLFGKVFIL